MAEEGELSDSVEAPLTFGKEAKFASPSLRMTPGSGGRSSSLSRRKWFGCSPIEDFEILEKVGEGTFGY
jgi:hypothetical protein